MIPAEEAIRRLKDGNRRFVAEAPDRRVLTSRVRRSELALGQEPFAVILGCSDSRVPAEIVFDQGLGELFVIRVAGNIVAPSQMASVDFAVQHLGARLVVVLGHSGCGAVAATLQFLDRDPPGHLRPIVERIRPAVAGIEEVEQAVRANIHHSVEELRHGSELLEERIRAGGLVIVGAEYSLRTGAVDFLPVET